MIDTVLSIILMANEKITGAKNERPVHLMVIRVLIIFNHTL